MTTPTKQVSDWLTEFGAALERGDIDAATAMFADECYWRDLVSFTWNIKTLEGRAEIADMLRAQLEHVQPSGFAIVGEANEADGVTDGWFDFETAVARGHGHVRLRGDECWTLLTTMVELKGHEEPRRTARPKGVEHGVVQGAPDLARAQAGRRDVARLRRAAVLRDHRRRPGRHRPRRSPQAARRADDHHREEPASRRLVAPPLQVAVPARPGLVRPPAVHQVPRELAGVLAQGQDRRLVGDVHEGDGAQLLGLQRVHPRRSTTRTPGEWTVDVERRHDDGTDGTGRAEAEAAGDGDRHVRACRTCPEIPGADTFEGDIHHSSAHTRQRRLRRTASASCSGRTTRPTTSAPRCGRTAPT